MIGLTEGGSSSTKSCDNLADLFIKSLPYCTFSKCVAGIDIHQLRDLQDRGSSFLKPSNN
jgi:hypothetical protein